MRIAIDMDEVLADSIGKHLEWLRRDTGFALSTADFDGRHLYEAVPEEHRDAVRGYGHHPEFIRDLDVMPGAVDVVRRLYATHEVFIATAAMEYPTSFVPKYEWLAKHFPFISWERIVFCGDKSVIAADCLIDDSPRHFERFTGEPLLFTAPHNVNETRYRRVDSWAEVAPLFL